MAPLIAALDDEADILELLKINLQKAGYRFEGFQEARTSSATSPAKGRASSCST